MVLSLLGFMMPGATKLLSDINIPKIGTAIKIPPQNSAKLSIFDFLLILIT